MSVLRSWTVLFPISIVQKVPLTALVVEEVFERRENAVVQDFKAAVVAFKMQSI